MAVRIAKVQAPTTRFPRTLFFHGDPFLLEPGLPIGQFCGWNGEREVQFAVTVMRRCDRARSSLLEEQQYLAWACVHGATALAELADDRESKYFLIEANRARHIAHIQREFQDPIRFVAHRRLPGIRFTL